MNKLTSLIFFFSLCGCLTAQEKIKKISIVKSNNTPIECNNVYQKITDTQSAKEYDALRDYVLKEFHPESKKEPEMFLELMSWVSSRWKHNGWNAAPDSLTSLDILNNAQKGEQYRCVEYGKVLKDILLSFGYTSRAVSLKHVNTAYGGAGMGHVATEVWSNKLQKWIFLDPQFNVYASYQGNTLNIYEIFQTKKNGNFDDIEFINVDQQKKNKTYPNFLTNYLGYIGVKEIKNDCTYTLALQMEGTEEYLTFQSMPSCRTIFTKNPEKLYYDINRCMVVMDYPKEEKQRARTKMKQCEIKTADDFKNNMHRFAAQPNFRLSLLNNMPWFEKYEVILNGEKISTEENHCEIELPEGVSELKVYAINKIGVKGIPTSLVIRYE
eukprot:TRINITY_DN617_c3_g1_i1.p2 TRINITY_DN617_c3_g1~~TRINITY_DN617_c3_g1_i1.p2  ORF type:complete len:382 (-),score=-10.48 TRINITY_DN617_c3_g1_i1:252-1397(-)